MSTQTGTPVTSINSIPSIVIEILMEWGRFQVTLVEANITNETDENMMNELRSLVTTLHRRLYRSHSQIQTKSCGALNVITLSITKNNVESNSISILFHWSQIVTQWGREVHNIVLQLFLVFRLQFSVTLLHVYNL